jgi:N-acetylneuraminate synthase
MQNKVILVGDIGINHNGDINIAKKLIRFASVCDIDYVKFQKRTIDIVYTKEELDKPRESPWGTTNREQKMGLEFGKEQYDEIHQLCCYKEIGWFSSVWDPVSVEFMAQYNPPYIKVPSALITNFELLEAIKKTDIPVVISTGMSTKEEVEACVKYLGPQIEYILACTSTYPTPPEEMNMRFIQTLRDDFPSYRIGFSNHSPGLMFSAIAISLGAEMVEFHVTLDRSMYGSDQSASIEPQGFMTIAKYAHTAKVGAGTGQWTVFPGEEIVRNKLRKNTYGKNDNS